MHRFLTYIYPFILFSFVITTHSMETKEEASQKDQTDSIQDVTSLILTHLVLDADNQDLDLKRAFSNLPQFGKEAVTDIINRKSRIGETLLHQAENAARVNKLLALGAKPTRSKLDQDPFLAALSRGYGQAADAHLKGMGSQRPLISYDITGLSNLDYAIITDDVLLVEKILSKKKNAENIQDRLALDEKTKHRVTLLGLATVYCPDAKKLLLDLGAQEDNSTFSPTCGILSFEEEQVLVNTVNARNTMGETVLHQAKSSEQVKELIAQGANVCILSKLEQNPYMATLAHGYIEAAEEIFKAMHSHKPFLRKDIRGFTTLHYALIANAVPLVKRILNTEENQSDLLKELNTLRGKNPTYSPLLLAARFSPESIPHLIAKGAEVELKDKDGTSPFLQAAKFQSEDVLKLLVGKGANSSTRNTRKRNAVYYAVIGGDKRVISYLTQELKLKSMSNQYNRDPLALALKLLVKTQFKKQKYLDTIEELIKGGADINRNLVNLNDLLDESTIPANDQATAAIKKLTEFGAEINFINDHCLYPLAYVIFNTENGRCTSIKDKLNYDLISYFKEKGARIAQEHKDKILQSDNEVLRRLVQGIPTFTLKSDERILKIKNFPQFNNDLLILRRFQDNHRNQELPSFWIINEETAEKIEFDNWQNLFEE